MVVKNRQLRERKFVNYADNRVRIQKENKKKSTSEAPGSSTSSSSSSRARSSAKSPKFATTRSFSISRPSRTVNPTRRYSPDSNSNVIRGSDNGSKSQTIQPGFSVDSSRSNVELQSETVKKRGKPTPISSRICTRSSVSRTETIEDPSKKIDPTPKSSSVAVPRISLRQTSLQTPTSRSECVSSSTRSRSVRRKPVETTESTPVDKKEESKMPEKNTNEPDDQDMGSESTNTESSEEDSESDADDEKIRSKISDEESDNDDGKYLSQYSSVKIPTTSFEPSRAPNLFYEMRSIWEKIRSLLPAEILADYKAYLRDLLTGRVSSLNSIVRLVPGFPHPLVSTHHKLYGILCQYSGAYPFKNHEGSRLVSKHDLADESQIGAQIILECLDNDVLPFDTTVETAIINQIQTYVRIGIKDMLQEIVEKLPKGRHTVTISDLKGSLVTRLLE